MEAVRYVREVSACRREPNSHETSKSREPGYLRAQSPRQNEAIRPQPSTGAVSAAKHWIYIRPQCHLEPARCEGGSCVQSIRWAVAGKTSPGLGQSLRLEYTACHGWQRKAGGAWCVPRKIARPWQVQRWCITVAALPNPSLKRSANGRPPGPVCGMLHSPQPGPGVPPSSPA